MFWAWYSLAPSFPEQRPREVARPGEESSPVERPPGDLHVHVLGDDDDGLGQALQQRVHAVVLGAAVAEREALLRGGREKERVGKKLRAKGGN